MPKYILVDDFQKWGYDDDCEYDDDIDDNDDYAIIHCVVIITLLTKVSDTKMPIMVVKLMMCWKDKRICVDFFCIILYADE